MTGRTDPPNPSHPPSVSPNTGTQGVKIMGILNVTPDSFFDGGRFITQDDASVNLEGVVSQAIQMVHEGAELLDVGGESTRPGSKPVNPAEQIRRVVEPIACIRKKLDAMDRRHATISIDTTHACVAEAAIEAGATMINDTSAGVDDPAMFAIAAKTQAELCLMHRQGTPQTMQDKPSYDDAPAEVEAFLRSRAEAAQQVGVAQSQILIDPGIGFGKTLEHNLQLLAQLGRFTATGYHVLLGVSRKRMFDQLGQALGHPQAPANQRLGGSVAATALAIQAGVEILRVHDVQAHRQAADTLLAIAKSPQ